MNRKIVQISMSNGVGLILCDDNSLWHVWEKFNEIYASEGFKWKKLPEIPQDDNFPGLEEAAPFIAQQAQTAVFQAIEKGGGASRGKTISE